MYRHVRMCGLRACMLLRWEAERGVPTVCVSACRQGCGCASRPSRFIRFHQLRRRSFVILIFSFPTKDAAEDASLSVRDRADACPARARAPNAQHSPHNVDARGQNLLHRAVCTQPSARGHFRSCAARTQTTNAGQAPVKIRSRQRPFPQVRRVSISSRRRRE